MISVAIDGPAGAGKSTLARRLAADFGYIYVDTGAMFRTIGLYALRAGKEPKDNEAVDALLPNITLEFAFIEGEQHIYLNGEDVSTAIRTEEVGMAASAVGANPAVRAFLLEMQRDMARTQNILMDGRDIGTVVLPNATVKIFLTASPEARATRRWKEYQQKGIDFLKQPCGGDVIGYARPDGVVVRFNTKTTEYATGVPGGPLKTYMKAKCNRKTGEAQPEVAMKYYEFNREKDLKEEDDEQGS